MTMRRWKGRVGKCCDYTAKYGEYKMAVAAFGNNHTRLFWTDKLLEAGYDVPSIVHPSAIVSPSAVLGPGCFIMQRAVVNTHTHVDRAALVNSGAVVDHDSVVCAGAHVGLGSVVKANCTIEQEKKVEAGEVISLPGERSKVWTAERLRMHCMHLDSVPSAVM